MQDFPKLQKRYQYVLIGYNLTSLSFAYELWKRDLDFCVIDAKHLGSSPIKRIPSLEARVSTRVAFNPVTEHNPSDLDIWGDIEKLDGPPMTFDKGEFKSFLGFGEQKIQSMDAIKSFCATENLIPQLTPEEQWQRILENAEDKIFLDQQVTDIEYNEEGVEKLILNGKSSVQGSFFYFFDHFDFLFDKMAPEMKKQASQFAKVKWHSCVNLVVHHSEEPEAYQMNQLYLLMGSKEIPCIGQFTKINGSLVSRWEAFFPTELSADSEMTGAMVKEIKKQMKRAFSFPETNKDSEHILVHERVFGDFEKAQVGNGPISHFNNLFAFSPLFANQTGWMQEISCAHQAAQELTVPVQAENTETSF